MRLSLDWVNSYLDKKLPATELVGLLDGAGIEVEELLRPEQLDEKIVIGSVEDVRPHPNADKLRLAKVDVKKATLDIVCGAPNLESGQKVVVATLGSKLPDGTDIEAVSIRGQQSQGMICSQAELNLGSDHSGIMVLGEEAQVGQPFHESLSTRTVADVKTAPNRWDLNSVLGISREVAAQASAKKPINYPEQIKSSKGETPKTTVDRQLAPRYMLARLKVDNSKPTPGWMADRLQASGIRPIGVVVDITNYVLLELGQPLHAFDATKTRGAIAVRAAKKGEKLITLDGKARNLSVADIVIADNQGAIGLGGVMGGANSEIDDSTQEILLEAAVFDPVAIRQTAVRHGLRSDASARFERGIPVELPAIGMSQAIRLLQNYAGAELIGAPADTGQQATPPISVKLNVDKVAELLGFTLDAKAVAADLERLQFEVATSGQAMTVKVPWWRTDVTIPEDLVEEVIKIEGYDRLPLSLPAWKASPEKISFDRDWALLWRAKEILRSLGWFEVTTYSFISAAQVEELGWKPDSLLKLRNPMSVEQAYLRRTLLPSLLAATAANRTYSKKFGIFEFSKTYWKTEKGKLPDEPTFAAAMVRQSRDSYRTVKAGFDRLVKVFNPELELKQQPFDPNLAHPTRSAIILHQGKQIGVIAQLHPRIASQFKIDGELAFMELNWDEIKGLVKPKTATHLNKYPAVHRDIALVLDREITWQAIRDEIGGTEAEFISDYYGQDLPSGKKSLAFRVSFAAADRTLTDKEADVEEEKLVSRLEQKFNAKLRQ